MVKKWSHIHKLPLLWILKLIFTDLENQVSCVNPSWSVHPGSPVMLKKPTCLQKAVVKWAAFLKDGGVLVDEVKLYHSLICQSILCYFWSFTLHPLLILWAARQTPGAQMVSNRRWRGTWLPVPLPAAAEQCWPYLSCKWGNLMVAINFIANPGVCSSQQQCWGLLPWSECQNASPQAVGADAVAVCPPGASWCWRYLQRGRWSILRADLHVSHSYYYFRSNYLLLNIAFFFENISCYWK